MGGEIHVLSDETAKLLGMQKSITKAIIKNSEIASSLSIF